MITQYQREQIEYYCKKLRLTNLASNIDSVQAECNEEFLLNLLAREVESRERKRINRLIKDAGFGVIKTFDNYTLDHIDVPASIEFEDMKICDFIKRQENIICYGAEGRGKTHLATAIGVNACKQGYRVRFINTAALVNELVDAQAKGHIRKLLREYEKIDLWILDEWGYVPIDSQGAKLLFQIVSGCYERKSIIITTNLEFGKWNGIFMDDKLTSALIDRLIHHSHLLIFDELKESYRLTHALMNKRK